jgi:hypothetical protein
MDLIEAIYRLLTPSAKDEVAAGRNFPNRRPYWKTQGWRLRNGRLTGKYRVGKHSLAGSVHTPLSSQPQFFISPPGQVAEQIKRSAHGACFRERSKGTYWIHIYPAPRDASEGILEVERTLQEVLA